MAFDNMNDFEPGLEEAGPPPADTSNRTFLIVAGILGAIMLVALLVLAVFAFTRVVPLQRQKAAETAQAIAFNSTQAAMSSGATAEAKAWTATFTPTEPATATPLPPTATPVVVIQPTSTPTSSGIDPRTATVAALLTQAAAAQTSVPTPAETPTELPESGFIDGVGMSGLLGLALLLVGIIFATRRLRMSI
jgi:hypothetical protein